MVNKLSEQYECPVDTVILNFIDTHIEYYYKIGFTPNMLTTLSLLFGIITAKYVYDKKYILAILMLAISYYFDNLDGKYARKYDMVTDFGDYYDHFSDIFKIIIIVYALYKTNKYKFNKIKYLLIVLILILFLHFGCQERIYNKDESPTLGKLKLMTTNIECPEELIKYTRYLGCGTFILFFMILFVYWKY